MTISRSESPESHRVSVFTGRFKICGSFIYVIFQKCSSNLANIEEQIRAQASSLVVRLLEATCMKLS